LPVKRALDFVLAAIILLLTSPLIFLAGLLMKLTSRGPMFYSQVRLGRNGRPFTIWKIRTMRYNCEKTSGARWCTPGDSRITPVGRLLRKTHIDELPQLWNVLTGAMSLIGPRPERPEFVPQLEQLIPFYRERMLVRPGLSGLAQIQLHPDTDLLSVRRKLACDLFYVQQLGFWLDLRLMLATALYLVKIPFAVSRSLLRLPGGTPVENAYQKLVASAETVPEIQTI
jgi:lipopolysaccharide/colanic/teichoic acid biosynthesis glycosyltransferase